MLSSLWRTLTYHTLRGYPVWPIKFQYLLLLPRHSVQTSIKLKALALELGVHGQRCAQFDQEKISVGTDG